MNEIIRQMPKQQKQEGKLDKVVVEQLEHNVKMKFISCQTQIDDLKSKHELLREETSHSLNNILPDIKKLHRNMAKVDSQSTDTQQ